MPRPESKNKAIEVTVLSYNILSGPYCKASEFYKCDPENCRADARFKKIKKILSEYIEKQAIVCLQEVTEDWAGRLHAYFDQHDYNMIASNYNTRSQSGHMGVALAFPRIYTLEKCVFERPSRVQADYMKMKSRRSAEELAKRTRKALVLGGIAGVGCLALGVSRMVARSANARSGIIMSGIGAAAGALLTAATAWLAGKETPRAEWDMVLTAYNTRKMKREEKERERNREKDRERGR
uniref:Endonuclease/exonuclease/phosphatase domain-containing protein n=1 Tax=Norrisiella sphaerica TaxID=552664 RepID=A0A7S2VV04_9EUKA